MNQMGMFLPYKGRPDNLPALEGSERPMGVHHVICQQMVSFCGNVP